MRNLNSPILDPHDTFMRIVTAKTETDRKNRLRALERALIGHYDLYRANTNTLELIEAAGYASPDKEDLEDCYNTSTKELDTLKKHIRSMQPPIIYNTCQYCGIGVPNSFDHYLPKSTFPEFAVLSLNLLPCCSVCNGHKGIVFLVDGERQFVNLYFDPLPQTRYLFVDIDYEDGLPMATYRLSNVSGIDPLLFRRIETHFTRLNLYLRYSVSAVEVFSDARTSAQTHCTAVSPVEVRAYLGREAGRLMREYSQNYWKAVLFDELSQTTQFIDECC